MFFANFIMASREFTTCLVFSKSLGHRLHVCHHGDDLWGTQGRESEPVVVVVLLQVLAKYAGEGRNQRIYATICNQIMQSYLRGFLTVKIITAMHYVFRSSVCLSFHLFLAVYLSTFFFGTLFFGKQLPIFVRSGLCSLHFSEAYGTHRFDTFESTLV